MNLNAESLVAQIQGLSGDAAELTQLHNFLRQSDNWLYSESSRLAPLLSQLDPSIHSLGYLFILEACTSSPISKEQAKALVLPIARFMTVCNAEQIRLAPNKFISVCKKFKEQVILLEDPIRGVAPMFASLQKIQMSSEKLTPLHPYFLLLCLLSKCYKTAYSILEDDIIDVDNPHDLFLCCYYGGMICIGQKQFDKALELLHNAVTAPMTIISAVAVEAYKKYILVSLIYLGQFSTTLPKYASSTAQRDLGHFSQPYLELVNVYSTGSISELEMCVQANKGKFESDKNLGLVKQVVSSVYRRNIQMLTQTYLTLSLQDIANTVQLKSPKEAEMHVLQMIQDGDIFATINQKDGMVRFLEDPEQYKTCGMIEHIDLYIQRIMMLSKKLSSTSQIISSDPSYVAKAGKDRQGHDFDDFDSVSTRFNM